MIVLEGLEPPRGKTPAHRRRALRALSDRELGLRLSAMARAMRPAEKHAEALADFVALPVGDVVASPFGLRMIAMAASLGVTTTHQELRESVRSSASRALRDARHDKWERGVLLAGKYEQFGLEDPFAVFHPSHTSKWGPHELFHRVVGFFHRRGATRFELYLGARLNELLPVVTWYGPEQALRLREGRFDRERAGLCLEAKVEDARWLDQRSTPELELAGALLREGLEHFERELEAIDRERATGLTIRVPHPFLDASSDALAYVAGHADRLEREETAMALELFAREDIERFKTIDAFRARVEDVFDELLFGDVELELNAPARDARHLWDIAQRATLLGARAIKSFPFEQFAEAARLAREGQQLDLDALEERAAAALGPNAASVLSTGALYRPLRHGFSKLAEGISLSCESVCRQADADVLAEHLATSGNVLARATIPTRIERAVKDDPPLAAAARFDAALCRAKEGDASNAVLFDAAAMELEANVILSSSFELVSLAYDPIAEAPRRAKQTAYFIGKRASELLVVPLPFSSAPILEALRLEPIPLEELRSRLRKNRLSGAKLDALLETLFETSVLSLRALPKRA